MYKKLLASVLITLSTISANKSNLLLLDTTQGEEYKYAPIISIAKNVNFNVDYLPIATIIDNDVNLDKFDAIFFMLSIEFLKKQKSPISQKILSLLEKFSDKENKLVGLFFPPGITQGIFPFREIFEKIGFKLNKTNLEILSEKTINYKPSLLINFIEEANQFLSSPLSLRGVDFNTTIFKPQLQQTNFTYNKLAPDLIPLPIKKSFSPEIQKLLPLGIYWKNTIKNNHIFVSTTSILEFSSIAEDFRLTPMNLNLKLDMLKAIQQTLHALSSIFTKDLTMPQLPQSFNQLGKPVESTVKSKCPWMTIEIFADDKNSEKQTSLINYIYDARLTHLWLSIAPNWYYSPIALRSNQTDILKKSILSFTQQLQAKAKELKQSLPKILVGFEIANNLRGKNIPYKNMALDMYGNSYEDAPAPLNEAFWSEEIIIPLQKFIKDWNTISIVPLSGVVLDLEMYIKSTGVFLSTMGFDKNTFIKFQELPEIKTYQYAHSFLNTFFKTPADYIINNKLASKYFQYLASNAQDLGFKLNTIINNLIPNAIIGCYAPNISPTWFYKNLYKGLSFNNPIMLFTFNTEFRTHQPWLKQNNINVQHSSALMLAKIEGPKNFSLINNILKEHDGIWLNRFSTIVENYVVYPEHTPLSKAPDKLKQFLNHISIAGKP